MDNVEAVLRDPAARVQLAQHVAGTKPGGLLRSLKIKLLSTCNLRCQMCRYWRIPRRSLPLDRVRTVLDSAARMGCRKVHLSGGEVTLYPDLLAVIRHAVMRGLRVNLTTNGVLVDKQRARDWGAAGLHAASFSLDGASAETHDAIRGVAGAFDQTIKGMRTLRRVSARCRLRINSVLQRSNLRQLPELIRLAAELGAVDVVPMPIDGAHADRPRAEDIRAYNRELASEVFKLRRRFGMPATDGRVYPFGRTDAEIAHAAAGLYAFGYYEQHLCYAPYLHTFIGHTGNVYACCMTSERMPSLGNILQQSLEEIFHSSTYEEFRRSMKERRMGMCAHCDQFLEENQCVSEGLGATAVSATTGFLPISLPMVVAG